MSGYWCPWIPTFDGEDVECGPSVGRFASRWRSWYPRVCFAQHWSLRGCVGSAVFGQRIFLQPHRLNGSHTFSGKYAGGVFQSDRVYDVKCDISYACQGSQSSDVYQCCSFWMSTGVDVYSNRCLLGNMSCARTQLLELCEATSDWSFVAAGCELLQCGTATTVEHVFFALAAARALDWLFEVGALQHHLALNLGKSPCCCVRTRKRSAVQQVPVAVEAANQQQFIEQPKAPGCLGTPTVDSSSSERCTCNSAEVCYSSCVGRTACQDYTGN